jgi:hypothetical protein
MHYRSRLIASAALITLWSTSGLAEVPTSPDAKPPADAKSGSEDAAEVKPEGNPPAEAPPPLPQSVPAPPNATQAPAASAAPAAAGQWIYTRQYGWTWMPYGDEYVYTPSDEAADPYAYVYLPATGWAWMAAPWIWGTGPFPYYGAYGGWRYHWYRGPGFHVRAPERPVFRGGYGGHFGGHSGGHFGGHAGGRH